MSRNEMLTPGNGALIEHRYSIGISAFPEDAESMIELVDKAKSELS